uniref:Uncharacterized protein n=1 Tax=Vespula pensylvanica TaxID=30213 RepID=A0A834NQR3_VESPE|nr:hypothetical protein H0235_012340 [Vespula pensylvanica]
MNEGMNERREEYARRRNIGEPLVLFGNGNIVVTREDIVHLTTEPPPGRESVLVHVMMMSDTEEEDDDEEEEEEEEERKGEERTLERRWPATNSEPVLAP